MKKSTLLFLILFFCSFCAVNAQSVIKVPLVQKEYFSVSPTTVMITLEESESKELGLEAEISGGSGTYTFEWLLNGQVVGTDPTHTVNSQKGTYYFVIHDGDGCSSTITYNVNGGSGLEDITAGAFTIYPNPGNGLINIHSDMIAGLESVKVYRLSGQIVRAFNIDKKIPHSTSLSLDLTDLSKGYYLILFEVGDHEITKIIILQ